MRESTSRTSELTNLNQKQSNGTPIQSKPQTPTGTSRPCTSGGLSSPQKTTPQKYDSPKAIVTNMRMVGHWVVADYENGVLLKGQGSEVERTNGRAEFALFLRVGFLCITYRVWFIVNSIGNLRLYHFQDLALKFSISTKIPTSN